MDDWEAIFDNLPLQPTQNFDDEGDGYRVLDDCERAESAVPRCNNCEGSDWRADIERGDFVCLSCGACLPGVYLHQPLRFDQRKAQEEGRALPSEIGPNVANALVGAQSLGGKHRRRLETSVYRRIAYFKSRLRCWLRSEPVISPEDWEYIESGFSRLCLERGIEEKIPTPGELRMCGGRRIAHCYSPTQGDVRAILTFGQLVKDEDHEYDIDWARGRTLLQKYGRNWMTIRFRLSGDAGSSKYVPPPLVELLLDDLLHTEEAFVATDRPFRRKAFPFFNEVVARLFEFYSMNDLATDFPGLRTRRARKKFYIMWWKICKYWKWPFLCKDANILRVVTKLK